MSKTNNPIALGSPVFSSSAPAALARSGDFVGAWIAALANGPAEAARDAVGDFAVGLTDAAGRVFLAVDRFAVRTLCCRVVDGELRFAARADELADPDPELDLQAVFDYLYFHAIPSPYRAGCRSMTSKPCSAACSTTP